MTKRELMNQLQNECLDDDTEIYIASEENGETKAYDFVVFLGENPKCVTTLNTTERIN